MLDAKCLPELRVTKWLDSRQLGRPSRTRAFNVAPFNGDMKLAVFQRADRYYKVWSKLRVIHHSLVRHYIEFAMHPTIEISPTWTTLTSYR